MDKIKALILDLDGVVWTENKPIGDLRRIFFEIERNNFDCAIATNNSTKTREQYLDIFSDFGVTNIDKNRLVTSSIILANLLAERFPNKGEVFVIGEKGMKEALTEIGFSISDEESPRNPIAVAVGIDRQINFTKFRNASLLIRNGIPFYGTNPDKTFPTPEGLILGTGAFLSMLTTATDIEPVVVGKPSPLIFTYARKIMKTKPEETLIVGDRLETDILGGQRDGCKTALVLSGVTSRDMADSWTPLPDYIAPDLSELIKLISN